MAIGVRYLMMAEGRMKPKDYEKDHPPLAKK